MKYYSAAIAGGFAALLLALGLVACTEYLIKRTPPHPNCLTVHVQGWDMRGVWGADVYISKEGAYHPYECARTDMNGYCEFRNIPYKRVTLRAEFAGMTDAMEWTINQSCEMTNSLRLMRSPP